MTAMLTATPPDLPWLSTLSRRRFIALTAAVGGSLAAAGGGAWAGDDFRLRRWFGRAFGADAMISLYGPDRAETERVLHAVEGELSRLEAIFSLYDLSSDITRLNASGRLEAPRPEFVDLLGRGLALAAASDGAFDPTVQPLWRLYADHFARHGENAGPPAAEVLAATRARVDYRRVAMENGRIVFTAPGMALTLNGIAQGYATDRIAALLRHAGFEHMLVDIGENLGLGHRPDGRGWRIGIGDPDRPGEPFTTVELADRALATSGGYGTPFEASGRYHHLFDPRTGLCANRYASISVIAAEATLADGLSTAGAAMEPDALQSLMRRMGAERAILRYADGKTEHLAA